MNSMLALMLRLVLAVFLFTPRAAANLQLAKVFWQLNYTDTPTNGNPMTGGQNFTTCCLKAVNESIIILDNGTILASASHEGWITFPGTLGSDSLLNLDLLYEYSNRSQFPCTGVYDGDRRGAPIVKANYSWLVETCPGWSLYRKDDLNAWLQPLSGFLIPAVIFCLSIPRRRKIEVPRSFFSLNQGGIKSYPIALASAALALIMVTIDTVIWLCICFAYAGPMIISGIYEALLDKRVLEYLKVKIDESRLTLDMRCRCLMIILIGNLDLVWDADMNEGRGGFIDTDQDDGHGQEMSVLHPHGMGTYQPLPENDQPRASDDQASAPPPSASSERSSPSPEPQRAPPAMMTAAEPSPPTLPIPSFNVIPPSAGLEPSEAYQRFTAGAAATEAIGPTDSPDVFGITSNAGAGHYHPAPMDTPVAGSGLVAVGVASAGVGIGMNHDTLRALQTNHQNGGPRASPWKHMEEYLYTLRLFDDDILSRGHSPRQYAKHIACAEGIRCTDDSHNERPIQRTAESERLIHQAKTRLKTMLHCQYSFGSIVGAPVMFFLGGFIFALLQSLTDLGDESISEGLAFGQWYMTIPHIAIVSGLLLAGNNPNILEGVLAVDHDYRHDDIKFLTFTYGLAYPSCYKVAWQWDRGHNKKKWLNTIIKTYQDRKDAEFYGNTGEDKHIADLREKTTLSLSDWVFILSLTMLLLGVPYVLAFLTAYFTPEVGLSCRSLTFTIYLAVQTMQIILWLWAYAGPLSSFRNGRPGLFSAEGWLYREGFYHPYSLSWLTNDDSARRHLFKVMQLMWQKGWDVWCWPFLWNILYFLAQWLLGLIGIVAAIGGTVMQLTGVYSADICHITTQYWFVPLDEVPMAAVSVNSPEMIQQADRMWKPCAIAAIAFMSVVSFGGWWYQRHMRDMFTDQVKRLDQNESSDTRRSRPDLGRRQVQRNVTPTTAAASTAAATPTTTTTGFVVMPGALAGVRLGSGALHRTPHNRTLSSQSLLPLTNPQSTV